MENVNRRHPNTLYPEWYTAAPRVELPHSRLRVASSRAISPGGTESVTRTNPLHEISSAPIRHATPCLRVSHADRVQAVSLPTIAQTSRATTPVTSQREIREVLEFDWETDTSESASDNECLDACQSNIDTDSDSDLDSSIRYSPKGEWLHNQRVNGSVPEWADY